MAQNKRIHLALDEYFICEIDKAAAGQDVTRSEFIRYALREHLYERRKLLQIDATAMSDEEVKEAFYKIRREYSRRHDHEWRRQLKREGH